MQEARRIKFVIDPRNARCVLMGALIAVLAATLGILSRWDFESKIIWAERQSEGLDFEKRHGK